MARTGFSQIDVLLDGASSALLAPDSCTPETVGFLQDMLIGQNFRRLPGPLGPARGTFGPRTADAINEFQRTRNLPVTGTVDAATLRALAAPGWPNPIACCGYLALVLEVAFEGMVRLVSITSQFEGAGRFTAINRNTDKAGLSFGLIQWAQKPGRLHELLRAFQSRQPELFLDIFADGDVMLAEALIAHTARTRGGTDNTGATVDPRFDLIRPPWDERFLEAGRNRELQRVQLDLAVSDFSKSFTRLQLEVPGIRSERGVAFLLDLANQHGDDGARGIIRSVRRPGLSEGDLLEAMQRESVTRVRAQFGEGPEVESTRNRRDAFRTSAVLSDDTFALG